jgi:glutathione peroxidase
MTRLSDLSLTTLDGKAASLADYRGKALLVVNVASRCGLTPHYTGLEKLYRAHKDEGLVVLGFPSNQFGAQEPGSAEEIQTFCSTKYDVTFPLFSKIDVNGPSRSPLYAELTSAPTKPVGPGDISWNFEKFVIDRKGEVIARFAPPTKPEDPALLTALATALASTPS